MRRSQVTATLRLAGARRPGRRHVRNLRQARGRGPACGDVHVRGGPSRRLLSASRSAAHRDRRAGGLHHRPNLTGARVHDHRPHAGVQGGPGPAERVGVLALNGDAGNLRGYLVQRLLQRGRSRLAGDQTGRTSQVPDPRRTGAARPPSRWSTAWPDRSGARPTASPDVVRGDQLAAGYHLLLRVPVGARRPAGARAGLRADRCRGLREDVDNRDTQFSQFDDCRAMPIRCHCGSPRSCSSVR